MLKGLSCEQENSLQKFKLPEPVLCIGGYLQIELLGRVQKQEMDGLYYIWLVLHKEANIFLYSCAHSANRHASFTYHMHSPVPNAVLC